MPHDIVCSRPEEKWDLSLVGTSFSYLSDETCSLTYDDTYFFVDDDDPEDDLRPDRKVGAGIRWSEARPFEFWTYFNRFVKYWPKGKFHVKYAYQTGFVEKKKKGTDKSLPLFEAYAIEMTERHLDSDGWAEWKRNARSAAVWLGLHMPKLTTVDAIDVDAKQFQLGYYREGSSADARFMPVVHLPLVHFKKLKRIYDHFPNRIWCISSETLGVHVWKKHECPKPSLLLHQSNKAELAAIGLGSVESHPMPGRCFRRPFGADYRTITPDGVLTHWIEQLNYFEKDGRTPDFATICAELLEAMQTQWHNWKSYGSHIKNVDSNPDKYQHELQEVEDWLAAGCPLEPVAVIPVHQMVEPQAKPDPLLRMQQALLLVTLGEKTDDEIAPVLEETKVELARSDRNGASQRSPLPAAEYRKQDLSSMRRGNWAKELLRLARVGLEQEDSVGMVVHEMAKWLWWIELHDRPEPVRQVEIIGLLTDFVLNKHNGCVSRLTNGHRQDVINQIVRCVELAAQVSKPKDFAKTREKWLNGGYKFPIRIVPALSEKSFTDAASLRSDRIDSPCGSANQLTFPLRGSQPDLSESKSEDKEDISLSSSCPFIPMCIKFDESPLPDQIQTRIKFKSGRNKILPFATRLLNRLCSKNGKEYLGRTMLLQILGYTNPNQLGKYLTILESAGVVSRGSSYSKGRNGKLLTVNAEVMAEIAAAR